METSLVENITNIHFSSYENVEIYIDEIYIGTIKEIHQFCTSSRRKENISSNNTVQELHKLTKILNTITTTINHSLLLKGS